MEISSKFTNSEFVTGLRKAVKLSGSKDENHIIIEPVNEGEFVTNVNSSEPHFFYMYANVLQTLNLWLPFTAFEGQVLKVMNVAPSQLHPNSRAFIKAFEIMCHGFE
ncbi:putative transmembrane protein, partial [Trifolium medium]|nr:putative transmembrane protein [Trifolium medium]